MSAELPLRAEAERWTSSNKDCGVACVGVFE
jgi:hypothetical protein